MWLYLWRDCHKREIRMEYQQDRTWLEISLDNLVHNFHVLSGLTRPGCPVLAVVKCNGSGFGALRVARELETAGCRFFGVATVEEAVELREGGITQPILVFGAPNPAHTALCARLGITLPVFDHAQAAALAGAAACRNLQIDVHMKVDTGLSRYGIALDKDMDGAVRQAMEIASLKGVRLKGVFSHAANAGEPADDDFTLRQFSLFTSFTNQLAKPGLRLIRHFANSPATLRFPEMHLDMVRTAGALNGFSPIRRSDLPLREVASLRTRIVYVRHLRPGDSLSYSRLFTASRETRLAIVPVGYGDGIPRLVGGRVSFLVRGKPAPLVGKLCMDMSFVDITDIPEADTGDVVTVFGEDNGAFQSVYAIADLFPGSGPEVTSVLGNRIPRFYVRDGKIGEGA